MDFTSEEDETLIKLVRLNPQLYDIKLDEYKNSRVKDNIWKNIGKELNKNSKNCKKRWKHIKDSYNRFKRNKKPGTKSGAAPKKSKWKIYQQLSFLEGVHQCRNGGTDVLHDREEAECHIDNTIAQSRDESTIIKREMYEEDSSSESAKNFEFATSTEATKRSYRNKNDDTTLKNFKKRSRRQVVMQDVTQKHDNETRSFCDHIGDVLGSLPQIYKIRAKQEIFNILINYQTIAAENLDSSTSGSIYITP